MSGAYEANTTNLRRSIEEMKLLPSLAKRMSEEFRHEENDYSGWAGWTDDFARGVRPKYEANNRYCTDIAQSLYEALDALVSATLTNLENMESTRTDAADKIRAHQARNEEAAVGDGQGKR
ncbi:hypothetical protein ACFWVP_07815 [Streptomyces sp. NPDC058637]|uniref:hypothetical protein n=1 Tax=Streptomyces sp. NPDC058637 TaxID=3346569 RepID=UPI00364BB4A0